MECVSYHEDTKAQSTTALCPDGDDYSFGFDGDGSPGAKVDSGLGAGKGSTVVPGAACPGKGVGVQPVSRICQPPPRALIDLDQAGCDFPPGLGQHVLL